jgi:hypothetical protein
MGHIRLFISRSELASPAAASQREVAASYQKWPCPTTSYRMISLPMWLSVNGIHTEICLMSGREVFIGRLLSTRPDTVLTSSQGLREDRIDPATALAHLACMLWIVSPLFTFSDYTLHLCSSCSYLRTTCQE